MMKLLCKTVAAATVFATGVVFADAILDIPKAGANTLSSGVISVEVKKSLVTVSVPANYSSPADWKTSTTNDGHLAQAVKGKFTVTAGSSSKNELGIVVHLGTEKGTAANLATTGSIDLSGMQSISFLARGTLGGSGLSGKPYDMFCLRMRTKWTAELGAFAYTKIGEKGWGELYYMAPFGKDLSATTWKWITIPMSAFGGDDVMTKYGGTTPSKYPDAGPQIDNSKGSNTYQFNWITGYQPPKSDAGTRAPSDGQEDFLEIACIVIKGTVTGTAPSAALTADIASGTVNWSNISGTSFIRYGNGPQTFVPTIDMSKANFRVFDLFGRQIGTFNPMSKTNVLPMGMYLTKITQDGKTVNMVTPVTK